MIRRPPRSTQSRSSAASDVYKRQPSELRSSPAWSRHGRDMCSPFSGLFQNFSEYPLVLGTELPAPVQLCPQHVFLPVRVVKPASFLLAERLAGQVIEDRLRQVTLEHLGRAWIVILKERGGGPFLKRLSLESHPFLDVVGPRPCRRLYKARGRDHARVTVDAHTRVVTRVMFLVRAEKLVRDYDEPAVHLPVGKGQQLCVGEAQLIAVVEDAGRPGGLPIEHPALVLNHGRKRLPLPDISRQIAYPGSRDLGGDSVLYIGRPALFHAVGTERDKVTVVHYRDGRQERTAVPRELHHVQYGRGRAIEDMDFPRQH